MIAGRDLVVEMLPRRSDQPLRRPQLFSSHHFISICGQQIHRKPQAREVDPLPKGHEISSGEFVALVEFLDHLEIVRPGNVDGPRIPLAETGFEPREFRRADWLRRLQVFPNNLRLDRLGSPERRDPAADQAAISRPRPGPRTRSAVSPRPWRIIRIAQPQYRSARRPLRACVPWPEIFRHRPATANLPAQPDEIDQTAEIIDKNIKRGEIVIDAEKPHLRGRRAPVGHEQPFDSGFTERGNKAVAHREIRHDGAMQRAAARTAGPEQPLSANGEVAQPDDLQLKCDLAGRSAFRFLSGAVVQRIGRKAQKMHAHRCGGFHRVRSGKRRPDKRRVRELTSGDAEPFAYRRCPLCRRD